MAKIPAKRNHRLITHGTEVTFPAGQLLDAISNQNHHIKQCLLDSNQRTEKRFLRWSRDGRPQYAVTEVTPRIYQAIKQEGKLHIGFIR